VLTQLISCWVAPRFPAICGRATLTIVVSSTSMIAAVMRPNRMIHRSAPIRSVSTAPVVTSLRSAGSLGRNLAPLRACGADGRWASHHRQGPLHWAHRPNTSRVMALSTRPAGSRLSPARTAAKSTPSIRSAARRSGSAPRSRQPASTRRRHWWPHSRSTAVAASGRRERTSCTEDVVRVAVVACASAFIRVLWDRLIWRGEPCYTCPTSSGSSTP
jgi:hypothetical protein